MFFIRSKQMQKAFRKIPFIPKPKRKWVFSDSLFIFYCTKKWGNNLYLSLNPICSGQKCCACVVVTGISEWYLMDAYLLVFVCMCVGVCVHFNYILNGRTNGLSPTKLQRHRQHISGKTEDAIKMDIHKPKETAIENARTEKRVKRTFNGDDHHSDYKRDYEQEQTKKKKRRFFFICWFAYKTPLSRFHSRAFWINMLLCTWNGMRIWYHIACQRIFLTRKKRKKIQKKNSFKIANR